MMWRHHPVCQPDIRLRGGISSCSALGRPWLGSGTSLGLQGISKAKWAGDTLAGKARRGCGSQASTAREEEAKGDPMASPSAERHPGDIWDGLCLEGHSCIMKSPSQLQGNDSYSYKFTGNSLPQEICLCPGVSSALSTGKAIPLCIPRISACCLQNKPAGKVNTGSILKVISRERLELIRLP